MKQTIQFALAIAASAAAMFAYMYEAPPEKVVQEVALQALTVEPGPSEHAEDSSIVALKNKVDAAESDHAKEALIAEWVAEYGSAFEEARSDEQAEFVAGFEATNVEPYNPPTTTCNDVVELGANGETVRKLVCESEYDLPRHPYYEWSSSDLATMAYSEPLAAQILGVRLADERPTESLNLLLHASALSSKVGPLLIAAHNVFHPFRNDGSFKNNETANVHVALLSVARDMGTTHFGAEEPNYEGKPEVVIDQQRVEQIASELKRRLVETQTTVTGATSLKQLFNV